jgi:dihydrofolate reductase
VYKAYEKMKVSLIVAVGENLEIGKNNDLLWHLPKDMRFFTRTTSGHYVIMGRKNWESIPLKYRPLSNRVNIVVSRQKEVDVDGGIHVQRIEDGIALAQKNNDEEVFIIGGGQIYRLALEKDLLDTLYITRVHATFDADTFFPEIDFSRWNEVTKEYFEADEKNPYSFTIHTYHKKLS